MQNWQKPLFYLLPPLLALCVVLTVNFKADLSAFVLAGDNAEEILLASEMQSGTLSRRYLISIGAIDKRKIPVSFVKTLKNKLNTIDGVVEAWLPGLQSGISSTMQTLYGQYASTMYSLKPKQNLAEIFSEQGLQQRAKWLKTALLSPQSVMIKKIAKQDPLLLTLNGFKAMGGQIQQVVNTDGFYQNLILETAMAGLDAAEQERIQTEITLVFKELNQLESDKYHLKMTGIPVFSVATQNLIQGDIVLVSVLSTLALILLFLFIFRSFSVLFQVFNILAIVILIAILNTQLIFGYVHGMTVAIGTTLVGICIDYPIHALAHAQTVRVGQRLGIITRIWPSMLLGGLTTMIGYVALGVSGFPGFQQVAVYAASGIIISLLMTRFVLPGLLSAKECKQLYIPFVTNWLTLCQRFKPWLIAILTLLFIAALFGLKPIRWMEDMQELTPELDYLKQNDQRIRSRMTSIEPGRFILVTGETVEATLQKTELVYPVLEQLKQKAVLTDYFGLYPWLLSARQQQINQSLLQHYLTPENQSLWQQALKQQGLSVKHLGDFIYTSIPTLTLEKVLTTPVKKLIDSRLISNEKQTLLMIWLGEHQPQAVKTAINGIAGAQYFSQRDMLNNMTQKNTERAQALLLMGLALIILLLMGRYKSPIKTLQTLLPAVIAAFLIIGFWSLTGVAVSFLHLVGFLLFVAICVDYGIFYQENRGGDIGVTYQAMAASMLTSAVAFGSLMVAESTSLRILAGIVAIGVILGFLLCPLIIKTKTLVK